ncbi:MAG: metallophosphoesterase [Candidatus Marsarchaeota archaeon]|jgi:putative SbcD/Mre11-related phosphoesterase|nr:metallophosphoesterase [Candidatus Marsarchaeota archaeon]MCL5115043.1 metallophosphoesterase [Candidatus Marsarchaeota archaeon]
MILNDDIELIDGLPAIFVNSLNAIVIADPHLGYEGVMAAKGMLIPKVNLKHIIKILEECISKTGASRIIVDGDIKNEFSTVELEEFNELKEFLEFIRGKSIEPILIKGNHDNFVERYKEAFKLKVYRQQAELGRYLFFHGEQQPAAKKSEFLIMGHEHPAIAVFNKAGKKEKLRCFLYGKFEKKGLLVMPAINYFAAGTEINMYPKDALLSPIFEKVDVDRMEAIAIGYGSTMSFGKIGKLRKL